MSVVQLSKIDGDDFDGMAPDDMFQRFFEHILDDDLLTAGYFDDDDSDALDDNLKLSQTTKYSMISDSGEGCPRPSLQFLS